MINPMPCHITDGPDYDEYMNNNANAEYRALKAESIADDAMDEEWYRHEEKMQEAREEWAIMCGEEYDDEDY